MSADTLNMFPWSPSWAEINYYAYKLPTIELHNELYGYLQSLDPDGRSSLNKFDRWLEIEGLNRSKIWIEEKQGVAQPQKDVSLQTFIRNHIHHPENISMKNNYFTPTELKQSIDEMIDLLPQRP